MRRGAASAPMVFLLLHHYNPSGCTGVMHRSFVSRDQSYNFASRRRELSCNLSRRHISIISTTRIQKERGRKKELIRFINRYAY